MSVVTERIARTCGAIGFALGVLGIGAVLCFHFPALLTTPELRAAYPMPLVRALLAIVLTVSFALGAIAIVLRAHRIGAFALAPTTIAFILGGANVPVNEPVRASPYVGLDWFLLNVLALALLFVPLERFFAQYTDRPILRRGWQTDLVYFFMSHVLVELSTFLTFFPAHALFSWARGANFQDAVANQPVWLQVVEIIVVSDLVVYGVHRAWHRVPFLWRIHAIHHSSETLDWLAGFRLHVAEAIGTRAIAFVPIFALGFRQSAIVAYLVFISLHAVFIHANLRFRFGLFENVFVTPRYHHFHHADEPEAIDTNFALHLPLLDRIFGTHYLPRDRWPRRYGLTSTRIPKSYLGQLVHPFVKNVPSPISEARRAPWSRAAPARRSETASRSMRSALRRESATRAE